jgi:hypothetical protein
MFTLQQIFHLRKQINKSHRQMETNIVRRSRNIKKNRKIRSKIKTDEKKKIQINIKH